MLNIMIKDEIAPLLSQRMQLLGTETAFDVLKRAQDLAASGKDIINLGIGQPDFSTPPHICDAAIKAIKDGKHGYGPANGELPLREAVAQDLAKRKKANIDPDDVIIVPGGKPTIFFAAMMLGEEGHEILYPNPGFPIYESAICFSGAKPVPYALEEAQGFSFQADKILAKINDKTRLLIINSPANPTGGVVPKVELDRLVAGLKPYPHLFILSDEIYDRMVYGDMPHASLLDYPEMRHRLIYLNGWSKTYAMTGWRLGYGVWPQALREKAIRLCVNIHSCVNIPSQYAAIAALQGAQDAVDNMMEAFAQRRSIMIEGLNSIKTLDCVMPAGAFYAFANITKTGLSAKTFQELCLQEAGVAMVAGTSFGAWGEGYVRLSYANSIDNIEKAIERIQKTISNRS